MFYFIKKKVEEKIFKYFEMERCMLDLNVRRSETEIE